MSGKGDEMKGEQASRSDPEATTSGTETSERKPKPSCASKFDAVYFCYCEWPPSWTSQTPLRS